MNIQQDFAELLKLLEKHKVRYMIVGGYAVAFHGFPRFTKDMDIYYLSEEKNISLLRAALVEFGFNQADLPAGPFLEAGSILKFGIEPVRIDLINEISGISFTKAEKNLIRGNYGKTRAKFLGKADLIKNKKASARPNDLADVHMLAGD
jgi:hypothetical protein